MKTGAVILVWVLLLLLLGAEVLASGIPGAKLAPPVIGIGMALLVCMTFMRLPSTGGLSAIFAMAGVFWLCILLGMGALDPATRHDLPAPTRTEP